MGRGGEGGGGATGRKEGRIRGMKSEAEWGRTGWRPGLQWSEGGRGWGLREVEGGEGRGGMGWRGKGRGVGRVARELVVARVGARVKGRRWRQGKWWGGGVGRAREGGGGGEGEGESAGGGGEGRDGEAGEGRWSSVL